MRRVISLLIAITLMLVVIPRIQGSDVIIPVMASPADGPVALITLIPRSEAMAFSTEPSLLESCEVSFAGTYRFETEAEWDNFFQGGGHPLSETSNMTFTSDYSAGMAIDFHNAQNRETFKWKFLNPEGSVHVVDTLTYNNATDCWSSFISLYCGDPDNPYLDNGRWIVAMGINENLALGNWTINFYHNDVLRFTEQFELVQGPVAFFEYSPINPVVVTEFNFIADYVTFNGSGSTPSDPDNFIMEWAWDFGDGSKGTGEVVSHQYHEVNIYNVTLNVTNNYGVTSDPYEQIVVVTAAEPPPRKWFSREYHFGNFIELNEHKKNYLQPKVATKGDINNDGIPDWLCETHVDGQGSIIEEWLCAGEEDDFSDYYFALYLIEESGYKTLVGRCMYFWAENSRTVWCSGDADRDHEPDRFVGTLWVSYEFDGPPRGKDKGKPTGNFALFLYDIPDHQQLLP
jgi:PKD repeat protein